MATPIGSIPALAKPFSTTAQYAVDDACIYGGQYYRCKTAITTPGAWDGSKWEVLPNWKTVFSKYLANPLAGKLSTSGGTMTGVLHIPYSLLSVEGSVNAAAQWHIDWGSAMDEWAFEIKPENSSTLYRVIIPKTGGTLALTAGTGHTGNLAALDSNGNPTDSGIAPGDKLDSASTGLSKFDASASYRVGVFVVYEGCIYKCTTAHTGVWNAAHFAKVELLFNHVQHGSDTTPLAIGASSSAGTNATALGGKTSAGQLGVAVGANDGSSATSAGVKGIAVGCGATSGERGLSVGDKAKATAVGAIAIGGTRSGTDTSGAQATAPGACQIGYSDTPNATDNSLRFRDTTIVNGQGKIPSASLDVEVAQKSDLRYALVTKTITGESVTLDDRSFNYMDARMLGSSDVLDVDFPALVDGKARDFVLALECGANPPTISYAAFVTIMAENASSLTPEEGMNVYSFKEFKPNTFIASRKLITTVVDNMPESGDQILLAMQKRGIDTTGITDFGGIATALGLSDSDTPQDAVDAVMN